jgi:hypothetical protein
MPLPLGSSSTNDANDAAPRQVCGIPSLDATQGIIEWCFLRRCVFFAYRK